MRNKTILITGANGNLGTAVTDKYLQSGHNVIAVVANESMKDNMPVHDRLETVAVDLANEQETAVLIQRLIEKYKQVDASLLLAGGFAMGNIETTSIGDLEKQVTLNFITAFNIVRPLFQHMMKNENGRIIFIGARPAIEAAQGKSLLAYSLSKSLLFKLAECLNEEAKGKNVTATVIVPSTIDTPLNRKNMPGVNPADWVTPCQLADILAFITSDNGNVLRETVLKVYNNS